MLLGLQVLLHLGVALVLLELARGLELVARPMVRLVRLHRLAQRSLLTGELGHLGVVGGDLGLAHLRFYLAMAPRHPVKTIDHAAAPVVASSPSRALLNAQIATSIMSSDGSRVVSSCVPSTGSSRTLITGLL